ncbi:hypothetical protein BOX15_Mlig020247g2, partial [Macrostomum lignano]
ESPSPAVAMATPSSSDQQQQQQQQQDRFQQLQDELCALIENCWEAGIMVCNYQPHVNLQHKMDFLVNRLNSLDRAKAQVADVQVPLAVLKYIDEGRNPQLYTRHCLETALQRNEEVKGKIENVNRFRTLLLAELSQAFEQDMSRYRSLRADPTPPHPPRTDE